MFAPRVNIVAITQPTGVTSCKTAEEFIAYAARVSNPSNQMNNETAPKLLRYLAKNRHWSPFEMVSVVMEIETTRDIARQILRHRSFSFQEFSQRYADPTKELGLVTREARLQDKKNRQNSIEVSDENISLKEWWAKEQQFLIDAATNMYKNALDLGMAKEQARAVLPEGLTISRMYMSGSLRSWLHYVDIRSGIETQKEHREVAILVKDLLIGEFPSLSELFEKKD